MTHILEAMQLAESTAVSKVLEQGAREVLFRFLLLKKGHFHFSDVLIGESSKEGLSIQGVILDLLHRVDEWDETVKRIGPVSRQVSLTGEGRTALDPPPDVQAVMELAEDPKSMETILELAPMPSFTRLAGFGPGP